MKKIFTLFTGLLMYAVVNAQCVISGFDVCTGPSPFVTNFTNPVQVAGTGLPLTVGAKYKFDNISPGIDGIITIDAMVNAVMTGPGVSGPSIDDDNAVDETGIPGSQSALFAPRIAPDVDLKCANRTGYVQFTIQFFVHTTGNAMPSNLLLVPLTNPNFLHFDMDGHTVGNNGWFREIGYVQRISSTPVNPVNLGNIPSLLSGGNLLVNDAQGSWFRTNGAIEEKPNVSRCAEVIEKSSYLGVYSKVSFRFGYDYKAASNCVAFSEGRPTRQYGSKFGCFLLPAAGTLPVTLTDLKVNYNNGASSLSWKTQQEINIEKYIIQRSFDGVNFEAIGMVDSRNSLALQQYNYIDKNIPSGSRQLFYRIMIREVSQNFKLTNIVTVKVNSTYSNMLISPNPASADTRIEFSATSNSMASIFIYDAAGKVVSRQQAGISNGNNSIHLKNVNLLPRGMYMVKLVTAEETFTGKLMVRN